MKKLFLTLVVSLALCGSAFAQSHWPDFDANHNPYEMQGALVAAIIIDGEPITVDYEGWDALEISAWVGDACRANNIYLNDEFVIEFGDPYPVTWGDAVFYTTPGEELTFKMYDHSRNIEYTFVTALQYGDELTLVTGDDHFEGWDNPDDVISLSFTSPTPEEPTEIAWEDDTEWPEGEAPQDVTTQNVNIPENTVVTISDTLHPAVANTVNIPAGSTVVIENGGVAHFTEITGEGEVIIMEGGQLYHTEEFEVAVQINVAGYENERDGENSSGWRLIATPVYTESDFALPVEGTQLNTGDFDLYSFLEAGDDEGKEWINFENADSWGGFDLYVGNGYLYGNLAQMTNVRFFGYTMPTDYEPFFMLAYTAGNKCAGWNLLGNPFTCKAYVDRAFYVLDETGSEVIPAGLGASVKVAQGFFVLATEDGDNTCYITTTPANTARALNINLTQGSGLVDKAIVAFDEGQNLGKIQLNPNHTKVYMTENGKDYAVLSTGEMGEMPVSFKAEKNGNYTLGFTAQEVSFSYLHLIDNMTGNDVNLLETPSYSFEARTTDYASRFKLVYATGNNSTEDNFAFFSNGSFVINNEGNATLQVVDVMGRIIKSESINGSTNVNVNAAAGVYMLRLVNGNNVKVQKVVVE